MLLYTIVMGRQYNAMPRINLFEYSLSTVLDTRGGGGGGAGYFLGGYVPPGTTNWHPVLKKISPKIDTPF